MQNKNIMILCKVVDNFGDIGVVYRLAKALSDLDSSLNLTIVCSNLESFASMAKKIEPDKKTQFFDYKNTRWQILDWNQSEDFTFSSNPFPIILECFQCGRPDWLEKILFDKNAKEIFHIFNIEYLTAEEYADDFHLLKCYTRSPNVKKMFFMPGFTKKTAGLLIDSQFLKTLKESKTLPKNKNEFCVTIFSYEREFIQIFNSLNRIQETQRQKNPDFCIKVLAAAGKSLPFAKKAWEQTGKKLNFVQLPFLTQEEWDKLLCTSDFNFVRGEESLARACLSGKPFFWHAYVQDENYQFVKVNALLEKMLPFVCDKNLKNELSSLWNEYNTPDAELNESKLYDFLQKSAQGELTAFFENFSENLFQNGNLAKKLLNVLETLQ
ncbi:elongation factor P maturation arginine rhamnosyltransferase EarP [Treponema sp.]|uniref:elongation factor P maturation arginine rhamnosyltransferase EarP n=1 Tax=Treponema sp. TaxID=166 RepID=UPI003FD88FC8